MLPKSYSLEVAGLTRELPLCKAAPGLYIAAFIMFSDVELTVACAAELLKKCPAHEVIITAESKGIPVAYEMARQSGKPYIVARKSVKLYMQDPIGVPVKSITTEGGQSLYLSAEDAKCLKGKRVLVVDDVISTGESLKGLQKLISAAGGEIVGTAAVLAEGDAVSRTDITFLEELPLFFTEE